jgi:hypothetical protein
MSADASGARQRAVKLAVAPQQFRSHSWRAAAVAGAGSAVATGAGRGQCRGKGKVTVPGRGLAVQLELVRFDTDLPVCAEGRCCPLSAAGESCCRGDMVGGGPRPSAEASAASQRRPRTYGACGGIVIGGHGFSVRPRPSGNSVSLLPQASFNCVCIKFLAPVRSARIR